MATGFKIPDGRDLSDIFGSGSRGSAVGFQTSNGTDLGYQFASGSTGITTGMQNPAGIDLGSLFGPPVVYVLTPGVNRIENYSTYYGYDTTGPRFGKLNYTPYWDGNRAKWLQYLRVEYSEEGYVRYTTMYINPAYSGSSISVNGIVFNRGDKWLSVNGDPLGLKNAYRKELTVTLTFSPAPSGYL